MEEAQVSQSKADFISKYSIACKEARETHYWLRLIAVSEIMPKTRLKELTTECNEIIAILASIILKMRKESQQTP